MKVFCHMWAKKGRLELKVLDRVPWNYNNFLLIVKKMKPSAGVVDWIKDLTPRGGMPSLQWE